MRLLITRPEPDGERTAQALRARGHDVVLAPVLRVETLDADVGAPPWAAVLMTSANAARAVATHSQRDEIVRRPAFTVGDRSAEAARSAGFTEVTSAKGDSEALIALVASRLTPGTAPLLYLAGAERAADVPGALRTHGFTVRTAVVYRAVALAALPPEAAAALAAGRVDAVLHFSARTVAVFLDLVQGATLLDKSLNCQHYCLSSGGAAKLRAAGASRVALAARPDEAALLDLVGRA
jgi:uroporphyrinogen-III synthase